MGNTLLRALSILAVGTLTVCAHGDVTMLADVSVSRPPRARRSAPRHLLGASFGCFAIARVKHALRLDYSGSRSCIILPVIIASEPMCNIRPIATEGRLQGQSSVPPPLHPHHPRVRDFPRGCAPARVLAGCRPPRRLPFERHLRRSPQRPLNGKLQHARTVSAAVALGGPIAPTAVPLPCAWRACCHGCGHDAAVVVVDVSAWVS